MTPARHMIVESCHGECLLCRSCCGQSMGSVGHGNAKWMDLRTVADQNDDSQSSAVEYSHIVCIYVTRPSFFYSGRSNPFTPHPRVQFRASHEVRVAAAYIQGIVQRTARAIALQRRHSAGGCLRSLCADPTAVFDNMGPGVPVTRLRVNGCSTPDTHFS